MTDAATLKNVLTRDPADLLRRWVTHQLDALEARRDLLRDDVLEAQSREFLQLMTQAVASGDLDRVQHAEAWAPVRELLTSLSRTRATQGFTPSETALFVFSLRQPLFNALRQHGLAGDALVEAMGVIADLIDRLGLFTTEVYQGGREELIARQQQDMLELSTPVVKLWNGILALPMIGTLDSARTQVVMETLLTRIVETGADVAIIDITGVPTVATLVAQHLIKTVTAARLMGADCIISGIRPQIAQTIVHLGVELGDVITKATLADAFAIALKRRGLAVGTARAPRS